MKNNPTTNILLIIVAILLIINLWATLSINRYQIVSRASGQVVLVDKLNGTYKPIAREPQYQKKP